MFYLHMINQIFWESKSRKTAILNQKWKWWLVSMRGKWSLSSSYQNFRKCMMILKKRKLWQGVIFKALFRDRIFIISKARKTNLLQYSMTTKDVSRTFFILVAAEVKVVDQHFQKAVGAAEEPYFLLGFVEYFVGEVEKLLGVGEELKGRVEDLVGEVKDLVMEAEDLEGEEEDWVGEAEDLEGEVEGSAGDLMGWVED